MHATSKIKPPADDEAALLHEFTSSGNLDNIIPQLARDRQAIQRIESVVQGLHTSHELVLGNARAASALEENSVHLVVTSPPYLTLKKYNDHDDQLGHVADYEAIEQKKRLAAQLTSGRRIAKALSSLRYGQCSVT